MPQNSEKFNVLVSIVKAWILAIIINRVFAKYVSIFQLSLTTI